MSLQHSCFLQLFHPVLHLLFHNICNLVSRVFFQDILIVIWLAKPFVQNIYPDIASVFWYRHRKRNINVFQTSFFLNTFEINPPAEIPSVFCIVGESNLPHLCIIKDMRLNFCIYSIFFSRIPPASSFSIN